ncbi:hypothetical protein ACFFHM_15485 [Halalkalibacter kiskunsagensis]|uniref:5-bromo-4-chloroindolyl phosphate hydrolysis protein n=1 Tax=Halalkalibacter kiskunsagensis TaxID=1548599 RepID=A0ABV6KFM8_9BACI
MRDKANQLMKSKALMSVGALVGIILIYTIIQNEIIFRLFVVLFLVGFANVLNKKLNALKPATQLEQEKEEILVKEVEDQPTQIFEKTLLEKEEQLEKIDLDRTQMLEELFSKADLNELERQTYRERIKEKESERSNIMQDLMIVKGKLQHAVLETKKYFVKVDPIKEIAASIESANIQTASIASLNEEVSAIVTTLTENTIKALKKSNYIDEDHNLTRSGYKALVKTVANESQLTNEYK